MHGKAMAYIERQDWENLLQFDQLSIEKSSGRIFDGWHEGSIDFAPTYKYAPHSDQYSGILNNKSGERRRIPAWCDRIVWHGKGMKQLSYRRAELRNSDHRPVCGTFVVNVEGLNSRKLQKKVNMSFKLAEAQQVLDGCAKDSSKSKKSSKHGTSSHAEVSPDGNVIVFPLNLTMLNQFNQLIFQSPNHPWCKLINSTRFARSSTQQNPPNH